MIHYCLANGFIDLDNRVTTLESTSLTFSGTSNYYSRFTSGGTISNGMIWDNGKSVANFMGTAENTSINIILTSWLLLSNFKIL